METISVEVMQKMLSNTMPTLVHNRQEYKHSESYYMNKNDIVNGTQTSALQEMIAFNSKDSNALASQKDLLRHADNRSSSNFHQILVDQEAGYIATKDPIIDVGDDDYNTKIKEVLGDDFSLALNQLIVDSSNAGYGWLHYWTDSNNVFHYAVVPPDELFPMYADSLETQLKAVERIYKQLNTNTGDYDTIIEYWDANTCTTFVKNNDGLDYYDMFDIVDNATNDVIGQGHVYEHNWGDVPFIKFSKNIKDKPELQKYKGSIDIYDKVYNGFANDLDDIQQTILILKGYGGESISGLWDMIKKDKAIPIDPTPGGGNDTGVDTLNIEIPTEARNIMLNVSRQKIFDEGQGIDPQKFMDNGALSGKAIKGIYASLELKATTTEKYFRPALAKLIRAIMQNAGIPNYQNRNISQKWTRTAIQDDLEVAQALNNVKDFTSKKALASANPFVEDPDIELENQKDDIVNSDGFGNQQEIDKYSQDK
ncbi:phage portal protein [Apilactobacillus timberlakei]|uniref:Phage portal protein n=1 Tax=Apilactobacillus timberlakei TaxID=2008380 RepID=A0ABY2YRN3_9LACO|nr:phage portal protein [Apilactobacillus timberlakei]TPR12434.1 phage portal protein [Apilactobacillus timberlakei]TPR12974.1 phage portal protein [Apilactobacillus timberlakei]